MGARENILARIRKAQGRPGGEPTAAEMAAVREAIARHEVGPQPPFAHAPDRLAQFRKECDRQGTTHAAVARAHDVRFAPVVAFWDGEGRPLAEPLKGMLLPDFYGAYLDDAIASARARLAGR